MINATSRKLRKQQTYAESVLWKKLRNRRFRGLKFRRQHPIIYGSNNGKQLFFVADFYCAKYKLIVELDGGIHMEKQEEDEMRESILKKLGYDIIRFQNEEVEDMKTVLNQLQSQVEKLK